MRFLTRSVQFTQVLPSFSSANAYERQHKNKRSCLYRFNKLDGIAGGLLPCISARIRQCQGSGLGFPFPHTQQNRQNYLRRAVIHHPKVFKKHIHFMCVCYKTTTTPTPHPSGLAPDGFAFQHPRRYALRVTLYGFCSIKYDMIMQSILVPYFSLVYFKIFQYFI